MVMIPNILILDFMTHQLINMLLLAVAQLSNPRRWRNTDIKRTVVVE